MFTVTVELDVEVRSTKNMKTKSRVQQFVILVYFLELTVRTCDLIYYTTVCNSVGNILLDN